MLVVAKFKPSFETQQVAQKCLNPYDGLISVSCGRTQSSISSLEGPCITNLGVLASTFVIGRRLIGFPTPGRWQTGPLIGFALRHATIDRKTAIKPHFPETGLCQ